MLVKYYHLLSLPGIYVSVNRKKELFFSKKVDFEQFHGFKGELHSNYIFLHFALIGLEWDSIALFTKMNFFPSSKLTFQHYLHKIWPFIY